jgi:acyl-CoA synthetase (AMP-forming)/AMP-acid ligase II
VGRLVRRHHLDRRHLRVAVLIADAERVERTRDATAKLGCTVLGVRLGEGAPAGVDRCEDVLPLGRPLPEVAVDPEDDATILYTSGTTGRPKGPVSTHRAVIHALLGFGCRAAVDRGAPPAGRAGARRAAAVQAGVHPDRAAVPRHRLGAGDAVVLRVRRSAETIVDGWLRTGDIGRVDDEGFVYVEDRAKDMILRGGENVYCAEVEAAVYEHPAVHEAAVFGVPHERLGEEVAAVVVPLAGWR